MCECLMTIMSTQYSHRTGVQVSFVRDENKRGVHKDSPHGTVPLLGGQVQTRLLILIFVSQINTFLEHLFNEGRATVACISKQEIILILRSVTSGILAPPVSRQSNIAASFVSSSAVLHSLSFAPTSARASSSILRTPLLPCSAARWRHV